MVKYYPSIEERLRDWAMKQYIFFTASAPLNGKHVNLSPKGLPNSTFTIFGPNQCGYVDATGSGNETISHIYENGRVTIMFCSFDTAPLILRFFCKGRVIEQNSKEFQPMLDKMGKDVLGARAIIMLDVFLVQTSCGFGVPLLKMKKSEDEQTGNVSSSSSSSANGDSVAEEEKKGGQWGFEDRATIGHWAGNKIKNNELFNYQKSNNSRSLDGLPGMKTAMRDNGDYWFWVELQARVRRAALQKDGFAGGIVTALVAYFLINLVLQTN